MGNDIQIKICDEFDYLSLFDMQFGIAEFSDAFEKAESKGNAIIESAKIAIIKAFRKGETDSEFVLDIDEKTKQAIKNGEVKLVTSNTGEVFAQLRDENGRFGKRLPIKEELKEEGISADQLQVAIQIDAIKNQLESIIEGMKEIEGKVTYVIQGQRNDRIGLFYSGLSLYVEAMNTNDPYLKRQLISQALKSISDANSQMIQEVRTNIEYLVNKKYMEQKKKTEEIEKRLGIIHQCYEVVYRAAFPNSIFIHIRCLRS